MGQESECRLQYCRKTFVGKAYLETNYLLFRGEQRLKIFFKDLTAVSTAAGSLQLEFAGGPATLELGRAAEKWAHKILHPPSLLDKLGIKPGMDIMVVGDLEVAFLGQIGELAKKDADLVFFAARQTADLKRLPTILSRLKPRGAIWVIYPKGVPEIREIDVIEAGRSAGLKDTKVASFSASHTALRFSRPILKN
jgi:hypothetical protein